MFEGVYFCSLLNDDNPFFIFDGCGNWCSWVVVRNVRFLVALGGTNFNFGCFAFSSIFFKGVERGYVKDLRRAVSEEQE